MKIILTIILFSAIFFGSFVRLSNLGWLTAIGVYSTFYFCLLHLSVQLIILKEKLYTSIHQIILLVGSYLTFLGALTFQYDFGDDRSAIAIEEFTGLTFISMSGYQIPIRLNIASMILFVLLNIIGIFSIIKHKSKFKKTTKI